MSDKLPVERSLHCRVQGVSDTEDCDALLVSDGQYWSCPYGHIQGFDNGKPVRKIPDRRTSVRQGKKLWL